jgi:hypothetical protein
MVQSTALAFYIACIAGEGAKAASFSISPAQDRIVSAQTNTPKGGRGDSALNVRFDPFATELMWRCEVKRSANSGQPLFDHFVGTSE